MYFSSSRSRSPVFKVDGTFKRMLAPEWNEDEFMSMVHQMGTMKDQLIYDVHLSGANYVLRYEYLKQDFSEMCEQLHLPINGDQLPELNPSIDIDGIRNEIRKDLNLRSWVEDFFKEDMEIFGYGQA